MTDHIEVYDNLLEADLCNQLIADFESNSERLSTGRSSGGVDKKRKDSIDLAISSFPDWQPVVQKINQIVAQKLTEYVRKYSHLLFGVVGNQIRNSSTGETSVITHELIEGLPLSDVALLTQKIFKFAPINMQKYIKGTGGYHKWHSEISPSDPNCEILHRVLFYIFYLNDVTEGGETCFYYQDRVVEPRQGRLVISPAGFTHTHKGKVPFSDDKYIITSWVKFKRFEELPL